MSVAVTARRYMRRHHAAVLSTISATLPGYPFASIAPFVLDAACRPVILISRLAEHTKNVAADARTSLIVHDYAEDVQAGARLTLVGDAEPIGNDDASRGRYLRYFPTAKDLLALGDFSFWQIAPRRLLFIRGFGRIDWIDGMEFQPPPDRLAEAEDEIVAHMNDRHAAALLAYCRHVHGLTPSDAQMVGIDGDGFDVRADGKLIRFDFDQPITNAAEARRELVALATAARDV